MTSFCPQCGVATQAGAVFCASCGSKLAVPSASGPPPAFVATPPPPVPPPPTSYALPPIYAPKRASHVGRNVGIVVGVVVVLLVILAIVGSNLGAPSAGSGGGSGTIVVLQSGETITFTPQQVNGCCQDAPPRYSSAYSLPQGGVVDVNVTVSPQPSSYSSGTFYLYAMSQSDFQCYEQNTANGPCSWIYRGTVLLGQTTLLNGTIPDGTWQIVLTAYGTGPVGGPNGYVGCCAPLSVVVTLNSNLVIVPG